MRSRNRRQTLVLSVAACLLGAGGTELSAEPEATDETRRANVAVADSLSLELAQDFEFARRGFIAQIPGAKVFAAGGRLVYDATTYDFVVGEAPAEVNPLLWRQVQLNNLHGLFKVTDGVYQVRGYDVAVMTLIEGDSGWIIVDPLYSAESSAAALELANEHLGERATSAVIITHSHRDHFGGIEGVLPDEQSPGNGIEILVPHGFFAETISESVISGPHMFQRGMYQFGNSLHPSASGKLGVGLALGTAFGSSVLAPPHGVELAEGQTSRELDGVEFVFLDARDTEAPAELVFYLPEHKALQSAELVTNVMHNTLAPRGTKVRDTLRWSQVIDQMLAQFGDEADVLLASHGFPVFGNDAVRTKLRNHRNLYRYIHDQTLRLANQGMTMHEIADAIVQPGLTAIDFSTRGHYGNFKHNVRSVYQSYFGWWDGVPANLNPLPPAAISERYVEFMGGRAETLKKAKGSYRDGDYRWAATVLNHLVFADADDDEAREWLARSYQQLGFQEESAIFRDYYLSAADELLNGRGDFPYAFPGAIDLPLIEFGNVLATRFDPGKYVHEPFVVEFELPDREEILSLDVGEDVLFPRVGAMTGASINLSTDYETLQDWFYGQVDTAGLTPDPAAAKALDALRDALDRVDGKFNVAVP